MLTNLALYLSYIKKAIVNLLGLLTVILSYNLLPAQYSTKVAAAAGVLTVIVHFWSANGDAPGNVPALETYTPHDPALDGPEVVPDDQKPADVVTPAQVEVVGGPKHEAPDV